MKLTGIFFVVYDGGDKKSSAVPKVDIVAGLKISKKAVLRNKIKRQAREIFRDFLKEHGGRLLPDLKIVALPQALTAKFSELKLDLQKTLNRL